MLRSRLVAVTGLLVAGCVSAKVITEPSKPDQPGASKKEAAHPGIVRYSTEGLDVNVENRRSDAYEQMRNACDGNFHIDAEGPELEGGHVVETPEKASAESSDHWYIEFRCETH